MTDATQLIHYHLQRATQCRRYAEEAVTENGREMYLRLAKAEEASASRVREQLVVVSEGEIMH
jgi:hypothetical protein